MHYTRFVIWLCVVAFAPRVSAQIPIPADAPQPLSPQQSAAAVELPEGFRLELLASEPLVRNPSGVCWDERGSLFVCELHGYNMEGQYDIEELNKTGKLDKVVRRMPAPEEARRRAEQVQTGTVKRLIDTDGDSRMDKAEVWADGLPACFGVVPARGGVIVVCSPDILFLADPDGDGKAEVRETLYTGFETGILERRMNAPKWGLDGWIYVGRGQGGTVTGPNLDGPVRLPGNDFRFRADGSAIEPLPDGTHTFGFAFSETGDRFVISTGSPAIYVAPLPWRYLTRNPAVRFGSLRQDVGPGQRTHPVSRPHPWRSRRAGDPGFEEFYRSRYGRAESAPNGYFTSACSPLIYQDTALPLTDHLLACEPAQNLVHRSVVRRDGLVPRLERLPQEQESEFLASRDIWFHPIALSHAPDGAIAVVDFYREIIEDYSAIPRYLQQQYRLKHGEDHGRVWRLVHESMSPGQSADMSRLTDRELAGELSSPRFWRRRTAQRLLTERGSVIGDTGAMSALRGLLRPGVDTPAVIAALHVLDEFGAASPGDLLLALRHENPGVIVQALRLSDRLFDQEPELLEAAVAMSTHRDPRVRLQLALSFGESKHVRARRALAKLAAEAADLPWMSDAILSSLQSGSAELLRELAAGASSNGHKMAPFVERLCGLIADTRDAAAMSRSLVSLSAKKVSPEIRVAGLRGLFRSFRTPRRTAVSDAGRAALNSLAASPHENTAELARSLVVAMRVESSAERAARLARAVRQIGDVRLPAARRVAAVKEVAAEGDMPAAKMLLSSCRDTTPAVREAILAAVFARRDYAEAIVEALERGELSRAVVSAIRRDALLKHPDKQVRARAAQLLTAGETVDAATLARFKAALTNEPQPARGGAVFEKLCSKCHQAHGVGFAVGPDLTAEFQRAEETFLEDILAPNLKISGGYMTYAVATHDGLVANGILASESPTSIRLRQAEGKQQTVLRRDIESLRATGISLMPEDLVKSLAPQDVADLLAWLGRPPDRRVLFDDDPGFVSLLLEGEGTATVERADRHRGAVALRVTPPQRHSRRIPGWGFRIRENPRPGEYRFIRFAWKSLDARGVMIEIANNGNWPPAKQPVFRYFAGENTTGWEAVRVGGIAPQEWSLVTRDLWGDFGDCTVTGIAPTSMGGPSLFDAVELLRTNP